MKKKGFTIIEMIISLVVFSIMFATLVSLFQRIIRLKTDIDARHLLVQHTYDVVEKINGWMQNYTIDYEEYFNRQMV
jgi:prepilin-type N-terminal cleavage/methylation domain-containing protein